MSSVPSKDRRLNEEQRNAVEFGDGPLLIIAGAGTGKTTVVTERIKHLISSGKATASEILALTFTEKAAREMEERVDVIMPYGYTNMWISTFHKFCDRILRQEAIHVGLNPAYTLMTETDATMLMREHLFDFDLSYFRPLGNPTKFISGILQHFSRLQDEDVTPTQYLAWVKIQNYKLKTKSEEEKMEIQKYEELAKTYEAYQRLKVKKGLMDFGDLITQTLHLFRTRKNLLGYYQKQFKYMLVDEYQDTNIAQNELVALLAGDRQNITAVCDDDQSIYKFRGAAVSNVLSFRKHFTNARLIVLSKNYRSTQAILDSSYDLIQHNNPDRLEVREHINKKLVSERNISGEWPKLLYMDRVENEADAVAKEIQRIKDKEGCTETNYHWKDFAILVRANNHAEPFVRALMRHGIPYQFLGPGQLFRQEEVKDLISYLQVIDHFDDNVSFFRVLSMPYFAISPRDIAALSNFAKKQNVSLFESAEMIEGSQPVERDQLPHLFDETKTTIGKVVTLLHTHFGLVTNKTAGQILFDFLQDTGIMTSIMENKDPFDEGKVANISKFFSKLKTYETDHVDSSVHAVLDWITLSSQLGESPLAGDIDWVKNDAVNILTIHGAKGLEFPIVFLVNVVGARFPSIGRREQLPIPDSLIKEELPQGDYHLEEERRLFYVGMTRARDLLYFTAANFYGEGKREKKVSPFVGEALGTSDVVVSEKLSTQASLLDWAPLVKDLGDKKREIVPVTYLSYSRIEAFRVCPLHYKLRYILDIPTPTTASLSFGTSMHNALRDFYQLHSQGMRVSKKKLLQLLSEYWLHAGYENKRHEEDMKKQGEKYLAQYFDEQYHSTTIIGALELPFVLPIGAGDRQLKIGGKIDRVDILKDGKIEIIDYKTGKMPSKKDIDANLQLSMYALAASEIQGAPFGKHPEDIILTLHYFESNVSVSTTRTKDQLQAEKVNIISLRDEIEASDFHCSGSQICIQCEYGMFCGILT